MLDLRWFLLGFIPCTVFGQFQLNIIDYHGVKYLKFNNPCSPDDTYCPLTCSQKYNIQDEASNTVCVRCICKDGHTGISKPIWPTTTTTTITSSITTATEVKITTITDTSPTMATTTVATEVIFINGIPNLLVYQPCSPRDNICPIHGCTVDGKTLTSKFCFQCVCENKTSAGETKVTTTVPTVPSTTTAGGVSKVTKDTLLVNGVVKVIVSDPCRTSDNLCPVEGCTVDLTTRGGDFCFTCNCTKTTDRRRSSSIATESLTKKQSRDKEVRLVGGLKYTILKNPCTSKDMICLSNSCTILTNILPNKSSCMSCQCD